MKKVLVVLAIILIFPTFVANTKQIQRTTFYRSYEVKALILSAENCTVEFKHSEKQHLECQYDSNAIDITYRLYGQTLQISICGKDDQIDERESVCVIIPFSEIDLFIVDAANSSILMDSVMETNSYITARNSSVIRMGIHSHQPHQIKIALQNDSSLLLAVEKSLENFRIDALTKDDTNRVQMGPSYPEFYLRGEYHYKRGFEVLTIQVQMEEKCCFELCVAN